MFYKKVFLFAKSKNSASNVEKPYTQQLPIWSDEASVSANLEDTAQK